MHKTPKTIIESNSQFRERTLFEFDPTMACIYISTERAEKKSFHIRRTSNKISTKVIDATIKSPELPVEIIVVREIISQYYT
jgi:hypothetical protein